MLARLAAVVALAFALSGCVLKSKTPLFPDSRAEAMLGAETVALRAFDRARDGTWTPSRPEDPPMRFKPAGRHYIASQAGDQRTYPIAFVALGDGWYVVQMIDDDRSAAYALVKPEGREILLRWLACDQLKKTAPPGAIAFANGGGVTDCDVRPTADPLKLFRALSAAPGEPDMKYVREP